MYHCWTSQLYQLFFVVSVEISYSLKVIHIFYQSHIQVKPLCYNGFASGEHFDRLEVISMDDIKKDWCLTMFDALTCENQLLLLQLAEEFLRNQEDGHD